MNEHVVGGVLIMLAMIFYGLTFYRAFKGEKHILTAVVAVSFDIVGSIVMASGSKGIYLVENFERLNIGQIFHLIISPVALVLMIGMLISGYFKYNIHKTAGKAIGGIWIASMLSGFLMIT